MEDIKDDIQEQSSNGVKEFNALKETSITDVVRAMQNKKTMEIAEKDEKVKAEMEEKSKQAIDNAMKVVANEGAAKVNESHFKLHKSASQMYGFKEERPLWQQKMMVVGAAVWFVIYFIVASFTVCPLEVFFDVFKNIFKKGWLSMLMAIIVYLVIVVGIPLLTTYLSGISGLNP